MDERQIKDGRRRGWFALVLGVAFLVGCVFGSSASVFADGQCMRQVQQYLSDFLALAESERPGRSSVVMFWSCFRWFFYCFILGFSYFGIISLPIIVGYRGFILAFAFGCFFRVWGIRGLVPAMVLFGLNAFLWLPGLLYTGVQILDSSLFFRKSACMKLSFAKFCFVRSGFLLAFLLSLFCVWVEFTLIPALFPIVTRIVL